MAAWHLAQASFPGVLEEGAWLSAAAGLIVEVAAFSSVCAVVGVERKPQHENVTTSEITIRRLCRRGGAPSLRKLPVSDDGESGKTREVERFNRAEIISRHTTTKTKGEQQERKTLLSPTLPRTTQELVRRRCASLYSDAI